MVLQGGRLGATELAAVLGSTLSERDMLRGAASGGGSASLVLRLVCLALAAGGDAADVAGGSGLAGALQAPLPHVAARADKGVVRWVLLGAQQLARVAASTAEGREEGEGGGGGGDAAGGGVDGLEDGALEEGSQWMGEGSSGEEEAGGQGAWGTVAGKLSGSSSTAGSGNADDYDSRNSRGGSSSSSSGSGGGGDFDAAWRLQAGREGLVGALVAFGEHLLLLVGALVAFGEQLFLW